VRNEQFTQRFKLPTLATIQGISDLRNVTFCFFHQPDFLGLKCRVFKFSFSYFDKMSVETEKTDLFLGRR